LHQDPCCFIRHSSYSRGLDDSSTERDFYSDVAPTTAGLGPLQLASFWRQEDIGMVVGDHGSPENQFPPEIGINRYR
jgi:hypothetical protein